MSSQPFYVYWLNHEGRRHKCGLLKPMDTSAADIRKNSGKEGEVDKKVGVMKQSTFVGHAWLLCNKEIDDDDNVINNQTEEAVLLLWKGCMVTPVFGGKICVDDDFIERAIIETGKEITTKSNGKRRGSRPVVVDDSVKTKVCVEEDDEDFSMNSLEDEEEEEVCDDDWLLSPNKIWGARVDLKGNVRVKYFNKQHPSCSDEEGVSNNESLPSNSNEAFANTNELVEAIEAPSVEPPYRSSSHSSMNSLFQDSFFAYEKVIGYIEVEINQGGDDGEEVVVAFFAKRGLTWSPDSTTLVAIKVTH